MDNDRIVKKASQGSSIELDGIRLSGISFRDPDNGVGVLIARKDLSQIKEGARCHRINGRLFEVSELRYIREQVMILGVFTENPTSYFMSEVGL